MLVQIVKITVLGVKNEKENYKINGVDLDLRGVSIWFDKISADETCVTINFENKISVDEKLKIMNIFKKIFYNVNNGKRLFGE